MSKKTMAGYSLWIGVLGLGIGFAMLEGFAAFLITVGFGSLIQSMVLYLDY